jgi:hypothetical protein
LDYWCFNATFNNISAISWRPVLVVEEAGEDHGQATGKLYHPFCNLQSRARSEEENTPKLTSTFKKEEIYFKGSSQNVTVLFK